MSTEAPVFRFTVDQFERMGEGGIFRPDERVELVDGEIYVMPTIGVAHAWCVDRLTEIFVRAARGTAVARIQNPVILGDRTEVLPDVLVVRGPSDRYWKVHPDADDVLLLIEVADTTVRFDRTMKIPIYARYGLREMWLIDIPAGQFEVYREPTREGYASVTVFERGKTVSPEALPDLEVAVDEVLPRP